MRRDLKSYSFCTDGEKREKVTSDDTNASRVNSLFNEGANDNFNIPRCPILSHMLMSTLSVVYVRNTSEDIQDRREWLE